MSTVPDPFDQIAGQLRTAHAAQADLVPDRALEEVSPRRHVDRTAPRSATESSRGTHRFRLPRFVAVGLAIAILTGIAVAIGWARSGSVQDPLAARAYAAAAPGDGTVYTRIHIQMVGADGGVQLDRTYENWIRPGNAGFASLAELRDRRRRPQRIVIVATARQRTTWVDGKEIERAEGPSRPERAGVFDPDAHFRRQYEAGRVKDAGPSTVGGRDSRRFVMDDGDQRITYDVDARTLEPIRWVIDGRDVTEPRARTINTVSIQRYERNADVPSTATLLNRQTP